jgi:hypothetical protein
MKFYLPEYALEEIEAHKMKISRLSRLSTDEIDILLCILSPRHDSFLHVYEVRRIYIVRSKLVNLRDKRKKKGIA